MGSEHGLTVDQLDDLAAPGPVDHTLFGPRLAVALEYADAMTTADVD